MELSKPYQTRRVAACLVGTFILGATGWCYAGGCDFLIADIRYLEDEQVSAKQVNVGIKGDRISYIGPDRVRAKTIIQGTGLVLTPGLIDVNSCGWLTESAAALKLRDGITTFLNAHGDSFDADARKFHASEKLNYATSVGLIPALVDHLSHDKMKTALEESLRYGAYTISLSPEYSAETTPELVTELSKYFAHKDALFTFHLRYSGRHDELAGIQEAVACAAQGTPVHILHITSTGASFHPAEATRIIGAAVKQGMQITYDFYPFTSWSSSIHRARFAAGWQNRYGVDLSRVHIFEVSNLTEERFEALERLPQDRNVNVESIPQATVDYFALNTSCPIGTDSEAGPATTHPRGVGSFTKFVNDYVDTGKISFGQAIYRFSTATARQFSPYIPGLAKRGEIKVGYAADLILWDRSRIKSQADFEHPFEPSSGVVAAFVNGVPIILNGEQVKTNLSPGRHLKGIWAVRHAHRVRLALAGAAGVLIIIPACFLVVKRKGFRYART